MARCRLHCTIGDGNGNVLHCTSNLHVFLKPILSQQHNFPESKEIAWDNRMPTALGWMTQGLLNRWTSQLDLSCTIGGLERVVSEHNSTHYANQYERYESKNRFVNPFETDDNTYL